MLSGYRDLYFVDLLGVAAASLSQGRRTGLFFDAFEVCLRFFAPAQLIERTRVGPCETSTNPLPPDCDLTFLEQDSGQNDESFQDKLRVTVDILELEDIPKKAEDQDTDQCSRH
jgi:hypothetical protein